MTLKNIQKEKGVAGLNVFLGVIVSLFMIGLIVMIFVIAGGRIQTAVEERGSAYASQNNTNVTSASGVLLTACSSAVGGRGAEIQRATNNTNVNFNISSGNYTTSGCTLLNKPLGNYNDTQWNVTYTYSFTSNTDTIGVINSTKVSLSGSTDWFDIFIVLAALVVLVLLVVVIVSAIGGAGLMGGKEGA